VFIDLILCVIYTKPKIYSAFKRLGTQTVGAFYEIQNYILYLLCEASADA
jgi:hypothetical protein